MASAIARSSCAAAAAVPTVDTRACQQAGVVQAPTSLPRAGFFGSHRAFTRSLRQQVSVAARSVVARAAAAKDLPTVSDTKLNFLKAYKKPIPAIYNNVIQELIVQHHLVRYNSTYKYDPVFALGFVTVYDQLMDGYRTEVEREAIFKAYISALDESPEQYRKDATTLEEWAKQQTAATITNVEGQPALQDVAERAAAKKFHYSRFFAIGLFKILSVAQAVEPDTLAKLCAALNVSKDSVDRDLDVYRGLLTKLTGAKELLKEFLDREKKKQAERDADKATKAASPVATSTE